jgi:hypothetical protein
MSAPAQLAQLAPQLSGICLAGHCRPSPYEQSLESQTVEPTNVSEGESYQGSKTMSWDGTKGQPQWVTGSPRKNDLDALRSCIDYE